ncbi:MAG: mandelate racemase/muconate lactonizing enzyme family protein [Candidatus Rokuibacteriota bacterium]|nr:MAG: mandelate racemase/muconate lactonizing enzyme family protein [Candidatus Rokubacteria bacterium]
MATGMPDQVFVPVMLAAMMLPMARAIDCPVLPQIWDTRSVVISFLRTEGRPDVVVRAGMGRVKRPRGIVSRLPNSGRVTLVGELSEITLRVSRVTSFLVDLGGGKNLLFVKIDTESGPHGWGECYTQADRDTSVIALVDALGRYLVGRDASHITHFLHVAYHDFAAKRGAMDFWSAVSGLEQALWDIAGKRHGVPVHALLGGPCRERIRVYANGWYGKSKTPADYAALARETVARGFGALKFDPFPGPWRTHLSREHEEQAVATVAAVREAVGAEVDLLIEVHRRLAPMHAVRIARALERFRPFWYEEPVSSTNLEALAECRRQISIPVVTGEELYTRAEFRRAFELRAADIVNPDVCNCGGILELRAIAQMAEPSFVTVSPHNYNSTTVGLAATLQVSAAIPNFLITEYFVNFEARGREIASPGFEVRDGYIAVPQSPGLGIELDEAVLARHPGRQFPPRALPSPADEGP